VDRTAGPEPAVRLVSDETVAVAVELPTDRATTWRALTEPRAIAQWFGDLSGPLVAGERVTLGFGDGDFFDVVVRAVEPRERLSFAWRFMGTGPRDEIDVRVGGDDSRSTVLVTDHEPERTREETSGLGEGWYDFLGRLGRWTATGENARYPWRSEVDVSIELPVHHEHARAVLLGPGDATWLSAGRERIRGDARLRLDDGEQPAVFEAHDVEWGEDEIEFGLRVPGQAGSTRCAVRLSSRPSATLLTVSHSGFADLHAPDAARKDVRRRFARAWIAACRRARQRVAAEPLDEDQDWPLAASSRHLLI
jgi:uncharacterized protein YndB with AHSA1/START domain